LACNPKFLDCGRGKLDYIDNASDVDLVLWGKWKTNANATQCFYRNSDVFVFGIYSSAVNLTVSTSLAQKYAYSLFWGFQASRKFH
jgi:cyclic nucleotide gated channel